MAANTAEEQQKQLAKTLAETREKLESQERVEAEKHLKNKDKIKKLEEREA